MSLASIKYKSDQFLACRHIAVIGVSKSNPQEAVNANYKKLKACGYTVYPVNPRYAEFEGDACFSRVQELKGKAEAALIFTHPDKTLQVVKDCYATGIKHIWIHKGMGPGSRSEAASLFMKDKPDINFIDGACPMMFIRNADWFHRGFKKVLEWTGGLPA